MKIKYKFTSSTELTLNLCTFHYKQLREKVSRKFHIPLNSYYFYFRIGRYKLTFFCLGINLKKSEHYFLLFLEKVRREKNTRY